MVEFRISCDDSSVDLRRTAAALVESHGWPRDRVSVWQNRGGDVVLTVDDELLHAPPPDPLRQPMHTRSDIHRACELVRNRDNSLRGVDFTELRDSAARFFAAGWSVADLLHALTHRPDGLQWPHGEGYQGIEWLEHRLRNWKTPTGDIRPSVSQEAAQLRIVGRAGLPDDIETPDSGPRSREEGVASPMTARAAADDARRLLRAQTRTTSDGLEHRDRTASHIQRRHE